MLRVASLDPAACTAVSSPSCVHPPPVSACRDVQQQGDGRQAPSGLLITGLVMVCGPAKLAGLREWQLADMDSLQQGTGLRAFRRYLYLDLSGARLLPGAAGLGCLNRVPVHRLCLHAEHAALPACMTCILHSRLPLRLLAVCPLPAGPKARLAVTEAVECAVPPHPEEHLPVAQLIKPLAGFWRPPKPPKGSGGADVLAARLL